MWIGVRGQIEPQVNVATDLFLHATRMFLLCNQSQSLRAFDSIVRGAGGRRWIEPEWSSLILPSVAVSVGGQIAH